ncbi:hypothetical protein Q5752_007118 [Cryptotrichosporon argae]
MLAAHDPSAETASTWVRRWWSDMLGLMLLAEDGFKIRRGSPTRYQAFELENANGPRPITLSEAETHRVVAATNLAKTDLLLGKIDSRHLQRLDDRGWINDMVLNSYIDLLRNRATAEGADVVFGNTFFYEQYIACHYDEQANRRWSARAGVEIAECQLLLVPINLLNMHWTCVACYMDSQHIVYFDSLRSDEKDVDEKTKNVLEWLGRERQRALSAASNMSQWTVATVRLDQSNTYDCGVYVSQILESTSRQLGTAHDPTRGILQDRMAFFRQLMKLELVQMQLADRTWQ